MSHTFTLQNPEKLNERVRKTKKFLKESGLAVPTSDVQHSMAILTGQPNWQTLCGLVAEESQPVALPVATKHIEARWTKEPVIVGTSSDHMDMPLSLEFTPSDEAMEFIAEKSKLAREAGCSGMRFVSFPFRGSALKWFDICPDSIEDGDTPTEVASNYQDCPVIEIDQEGFHFIVYEKYSGEACESEYFSIDQFVDHSPVVVEGDDDERCKKCESSLDEEGFCFDRACPYNDWPQEVEYEDLIDESANPGRRERFRQKYPDVQKRFGAGAIEEKLFGTCALCGSRRPVEVLIVGLDVSRAALEDRQHFVSDGDEIDVCPDCHPDVEM